MEAVGEQRAHPGLRLQCEKDVLTAVASGVLSIHGMRDIRRVIANESRAGQAVVVDMRGVIWLIDGRAMAKFGAEAATGAHKVELPVAMLVSPMHRTAAARYCATVAESGLIRASFTDAPSAYSWARRRAMAARRG